MSLSRILPCYDCIGHQILTTFVCFYSYVRLVDLSWTFQTIRPLLLLFIACRTVMIQQLRVHLKHWLPEQCQRLNIYINWRSTRIFFLLSLWSGLGVLHTFHISNSTICRHYCASNACCITFRHHFLPGLEKQEQFIL